MTNIYIEADRRKVFSDNCAKSKDGHKVVRMFSEVPLLGCIHCHRRNRKVRLTGEKLFHYMVDTMNASTDEAFAASGHLPPRSKAASEARKRTLAAQKHPDYQSDTAPS